MARVGEKGQAHLSYHAVHQISRIRSPVLCWRSDTCVKARCHIAHTSHTRNRRTVMNTYPEGRGVLVADTCQLEVCFPCRFAQLLAAGDSAQSASLAQSGCSHQQRPSCIRRAFNLVGLLPSFPLIRLTDSPRADEHCESRNTVTGSFRRIGSVLEIGSI